MDIVDNAINSYKFVINVNKRHISYTNNISVWNKIHVKYINHDNRDIILNYKMFLNQRNKITIIKCIEIHINVVPIICNVGDFNNYIEKTFYHANKFMLKLLSKYIGPKINLPPFHKKKMVQYRDFVFKFLYKKVSLTKEFCLNAVLHYRFLITLRMVKFLNKHMEFTEQDFISISRNKINFLIGNNDSLYIIKYLHVKNKLSKENFKFGNEYWYVMYCRTENINVIKYLYKKLKFSIHDFLSDRNYMCSEACKIGNLDIVKYLHKEVKFTKDDFKSYDNIACELACQFNRLNVVEYLHDEVGFTKEDFQTACLNGHIDIIKYLHKEVKFTKEDFEFNNNQVLEAACKSLKYEVVKYLIQDVNIDIKK